MTSDAGRNSILETTHKPSALIPPSSPLSVQHGSTKKNLPWRVASDVIAAASAAGLTAPLITIIDRYPVASVFWIK